MDLFDKNRTIGSITVDFPQAAKIFKDFDIDFCCGGNRLLSDVIAKQGINESELFNKLSQMQKDRSNTYKDIEKGFNNMSTAALSAYIEDIHHSYLRIALPEISDILNTVLRVHGKNHRELYELYSLFGRLRGELEQHLLKEETLLFPAFLNEDENRNEIASLAAIIIKEHETAGEVLLQMRKITKDYTLPPDACGSYHKVFDMLMHMESDLHQHIHLENNILLRQYDERTAAK
ncbi:MAG: iron-sulfur cluster repair di-iron protein [Eubacteriales bacterium]